MSIPMKSASILLALSFFAIVELSEAHATEDDDEIDDDDDDSDDDDADDNDDDDDDDDERKDEHKKARQPRKSSSVPLKITLTAPDSKVRKYVHRLHAVAKKTDSTRPVTTPRSTSAVPGKRGVSTVTPGVSTVRTNTATVTNTGHVVTRSTQTTATKPQYHTTTSTKNRQVVPTGLFLRSLHVTHTARAKTRAVPFSTPTTPLATSFKRLSATTAPVPTSTVPLSTDMHTMPTAQSSAFRTPLSTFISPSAMSTAQLSTSPGPLSTSTTPLSPFNAPLSMTTARLSASTGPMPSSTGPLSASTGPLSASTGPLSASTAPLSASTGLLSASTGPLSTSTGPLSTSIAPLSTSIAPLSTSIAPLSTSIAPLSTPDASSSTSTAPQSAVPLSVSAVPLSVSAVPLSVSAVPLTVPATLLSTNAPLSSGTSPLPKTAIPVSTSTSRHSAVDIRVYADSSQKGNSPSDASSPDDEIDILKTLPKLPRTGRSSEKNVDGSTRAAGGAIGKENGRTSLLSLLSSNADLANLTGQELTKSGLVVNINIQGHNQIDFNKESDHRQVLKCDICRNNGHCILDGKHFIGCICQDTFAGSRCEKLIATKKRPKRDVVTGENITVHSEIKKDDKPIQVTLRQTEYGTLASRSRALAGGLILLTVAAFIFTISAFIRSKRQGYISAENHRERSLFDYDAIQSEQQSTWKFDSLEEEV